MNLKTILLAIVLAFTVEQCVHAANLQYACIACTQDPIAANSGVITWPAWYNLTGGPIYVTKVAVWVGLSQGTISDVTVQPCRAIDGFPLFPLGWDHYQDPTAPSTYMWSFSPDYVTIGKGGAIVTNAGGGTGSYNALNYAPNPDPSNQPAWPHALTFGFAVWIYFTTTPPS